MGKISELFAGKKDQAAIASKVMEELRNTTSPVRVEIEGTTMRFFSKFMVRSGAVVLKYPEQLSDHMSEGGRLRVAMPDSPGDSLCVEITSARYGGTGKMSTGLGQMTVLCKIPDATVETSRRSSARYSISHYSGILLGLSSQSQTFPVIDISYTGVRVRLDTEEQKQNFPLGSYLNKGGIQLGKKARITILDAIPRCHFPSAVGIEIVVDPKGMSVMTMNHFLDKLAEEEEKLAASDENDEAQTS